MKKFLKALAVFILTIALAFTFAACGGGNGPESGTETPGTETPGTETPGTDSPGTENPGTETPGTETPGTDNPGTETPGTDDPASDSDGLSMLINAVKALTEQESIAVTGDMKVDITSAEAGELASASVSDIAIKLAKNDYNFYDIDFSATAESGNVTEPNDVKFILKDLNAYTYNADSGWISQGSASVSSSTWLYWVNVVTEVLSVFPDIAIEDADIAGVDVNVSGTGGVQLEVSIDAEAFCGFVADTLKELGKASLSDYDVLIKSLLTHNVTVNQLVAAVDGTLLAPIGVTLGEVLSYDEFMRSLFIMYVSGFAGSASQPGEEAPEAGGGLPDNEQQTMPEPAPYAAGVEVYAADGADGMPWDDMTEFINSLYTDFTGTLYEYFTAIAPDEIKDEIAAPNNGENGYDYIIRLFGDWTVSDFVSYMTLGEVDGDTVIDSLLAAYEEYKDVTVDEALTASGNPTLEYIAEMLDMVAPKGEVNISAKLDGEGRLTALSADVDFSLNAPQSAGSLALQSTYAFNAEFTFDYSKVEITAPTVG